MGLVSLISLITFLPSFGGAGGGPFSSHQLLLQLLQRNALGFRTTANEVEETADTDDGVDPERAAAAKACIQRRERERKRGATCPEGEGTSGHGDATHTIGEYLGKQHPCNGAKGHGIA